MWKQLKHFLVWRERSLRLSPPARGVYPDPRCLLALWCPGLTCPSLFSSARCHIWQFHAGSWLGGQHVSPVSSSALPSFLPAHVWHIVILGVRSLAADVHHLAHAAAKPCAVCTVQLMATPHHVHALTHGVVLAFLRPTSHASVTCSTCLGVQPHHNALLSAVALSS